MNTRIVLVIATFLVSASIVSAQGVITNPTKSYRNNEGIQVSSATGTSNGYEYVDLGLSVKWARCNIGASSPSDYGDYYSWGETVTKSDYSSSVTTGINLVNIAGNPQYDAARANWGGKWRLPTKSEIYELIDKCKWEWMILNAHNGYMVTGPNGNSIFLPIAGCFVYLDETILSNQGTEGRYWTSESNTAFKDYITADELCLTSDKINIYATGRNVGHSIRPVSP